MSTINHLFHGGNVCALRGNKSDLARRGDCLPGIIIITWLRLLTQKVLWVR